jgi:hypothetical protein
MNVAQALHTELKASTNITALSSNRIRPLAAKQGDRMPYVVYQQVSHIPEHAMVADPKINRRRFQISVRSTSYSVVIALSTAIRAALRDKQGTLGTSNFKVQRIFFDAEYDYPEIDPETEKFIFHRAQDFIIWSTG